MPKQSVVRVAHIAIRDAMDEAVAKLSPDDYKAVLEEVQADIDGRLDAIREESEED